LAEKIIRIVDVHMSLKSQKDIFKLPNLSKALPLVENKEAHSGSFGSLMHFVDRVGTGIDRFTEAVGESVRSAPPSRHVLAVVQASGSGKTKLAYDVSLKGHITSVVATVVSSSCSLSPPFHVLTTPIVK